MSPPMARAGACARRRRGAQQPGAPAAARRRAEQRAARPPRGGQSWARRPTRQVRTPSRQGHAKRRCWALRCRCRRARAPLLTALQRGHGGAPAAGAGLQQRRGPEEGRGAGAQAKGHGQVRRLRRRRAAHPVAPWSHLHLASRWEGEQETRTAPASTSRRGCRRTPPACSVKPPADLGVQRVGGIAVGPGGVLAGGAPGDGSPGVPQLAVAGSAVVRPSRRLPARPLGVAWSRAPSRPRPAARLALAGHAGGSWAGGRQQGRGQRRGGRRRLFPAAAAQAPAGAPWYTSTSMASRGHACEAGKPQGLRPHACKPRAPRRRTHARAVRAVAVGVLGASRRTCVGSCTSSAPPSRATSSPTTPTSSEWGAAGSSSCVSLLSR